MLDSDQSSEHRRVISSQEFSQDTVYDYKQKILFLPLAFERRLFLGQRILFCISCILHVPALFCLLRETPPHQAQIKPILVLLHVRGPICYFPVKNEDIASSSLYTLSSLTSCTRSHARRWCFPRHSPRTANGSFWTFSRPQPLWFVFERPD